MSSSCGRLEDDGTRPVAADQQDIIPGPDASAVGIRGPPDLPGMRLVDPDISNWKGQIIYLDFDGGQDVVYDGPITESHIDVPAFHAPEGLAGQEEAIPAQTLERLCSIFASSGIQFTTAEPGGGTAYSTIYVGGDDSPFAQYGSFLGLAEKVDVGNQERADNAFVFSEQISQAAQTAGEYAAFLAELVAHEAGHLLGFAHEASPVGGGPLSAVAEEIIPERPLIFIPGFAGTLAADESDAGFQEWLLNPGLDPNKLALEPLQQTYDNLVQSFVEVGYTLFDKDTYTPGSYCDFFVALWDWRVPVALEVAAYDDSSTGEVFDGELSSVTGATLFSSNSDGRFDSGLAYLAYWLDQAVSIWTDLHGGIAPDGVDIVTHSTGGLVARSYIQSAAYEDPYGGRQLPAVYNLVQVGVPNEGVECTYNFLQNDFSQKVASRVLGLLTGQAFKLVQSGQSVHLPNGTTLTKADLDAQGDNAEKWFIRQYVGTLQDLLPTYDEAINSGSGLRPLSEEMDGIENELLLDLNAYKTEGSPDPNAWVDLVQGTTTIVYGTQVDTEDRILLRKGADVLLGLDNELLPLGRYIGDWPGDTTSWYQDAESSAGGPEGDGTVPTASSVGLFQGDTRIGKKPQLVEIGTPASPVEHTGLPNDVSGQRVIIEAVTGIVQDSLYISTGLELGTLDAAQKLLDVGVVDIVDFITELSGRLPSLLTDVAGTARGQLGRVLDLALNSLCELVAGLFDGGYTRTASTPIGDVTLRFDASGLEVTANLDISLDEYFFARGRITLRKPLSIETVDVVTGAPLMPASLREQLLGILAEISGLPLAQDYNCQFASDYSAIENVPVTTVEIVASHLTAFAGVNGPYWTSDTDIDGVVDADETNAEATGLVLNDVNLAFTLLVPLLPRIPIFYALEATAGGVQFVGLEDFVEAAVSNIRVEINKSTGWWGGPFTPVIDFAASFPVETVGDNGVFDPSDDTDGDGKQDPAGYEVSTGPDTPSLYIDLDGNPRVAASADTVLLKISEFVHLFGSFSFEKGPTVQADVATGLPGNIGDLLEGLGDLISEDAGAALQQLGSTISNLEMNTLQIGASGVNAFIGLNGPYLQDSDTDGDFGTDTDGDQRLELDPNGDGNMADSEFDPVNPDAVGLVVANLDVGFVMMEPTINGLAAALIADDLALSLDQVKAVLPKFYALKATADFAGMVGLEGILECSGTNVLVEVNSGREWPGGFGPPVIDFEASFPAETADTDGDGVLDPAGFEVRTGTTTDPIYIDFGGDGRIAASADSVLLQVAGFVHVIGSLAFEKGPSYRVDITTGLPGDLTDFGGSLLEALTDLPREGTIGLGEDDLQIANDLSMIRNVEVESLQIGLSGAHAFVGLNGPYKTDLDQDGSVADETVVNDAAVGLVLDDLDLGFVMMAPTLAALPGFDQVLPKFYALKASADMVAFVGLSDLALSLEGIEVAVNSAKPWPGNLGTPIVDFEASFPAETADTDGDGVLDPAGFEVRTGTTTDPIYIDFDGNERVGASVAKATLQISEFVYITGSFAFEQGPAYTVTLGGGLLGDVVDGAQALLDSFGLSDLPIPLLDPEVELGFMTVGASNVHAFVGIDGPYWEEDKDGDGQIDKSTDPLWDEVNEDAAGLVLNDLDFGLAIMKPTNPLNPGRYFALKGTAASISLEGISGVTATAQEIGVEVNQSTPSVYGVSLFPVVDFASTYPSEQLALFDTSQDGEITVGELRALDGQAGFADLYTDTALDTDVVELETLVQTLDTNHNGLLELTEAYPLAGAAAVDAADLDGDGKLDPTGFEVPTGGDPVYLGMDSSLIRAQGFVNLNILDSIILTGSVAFEMGPTETVTLADGNTKDVTTMTIGAASVKAFIGVDGPYWSDLDGDHKVSWSDAAGNPLTAAYADANGDGLVDVDETEELDDEAVGFHVTDLDVGIMVMAAIGIDPNTLEPDLGVYLAAKLNVHGFELVGIDGLTAEGAFDIELNVGFGIDGLDASFVPVDFVESFSEVPALFDLLDSNNDDIIDQAEQTAALVSGYIGTNITTVSQLVSVLNTSGSPPDDYLDINEEILGNLKSTFITANQAALDDVDVDNNGRLNTGFEVNTGNEDAPVVLEFEQFQINIQLGGEIELSDVFRMYGVFLFEVDSSGLKAFVAAGLEVGPDDIGASNNDKILVMNALGVLVINGDGIAADIEVSVSVGGALSSVLEFNASARLVFNTTGDPQDITIPAKYVDFLTGDDDIATSLPGSETYNPSASADLAGMLDGRYTLNGDGSATFTIDGGAPRLDGGFDAPGAYFLVSLHGDLTIASTFVITADFLLKISDDGLELGFNGTIDLGGFVTLDVAGGGVIKDGVFAAYAAISVNIDILGVNISGIADFEVNSGSDNTSVFDALGKEHEITGNTFRVSVHGADANGNGMIDDDEEATIHFFGVLTAEGSVEIAVVDGEFSIDVDATIDFFGILGIAVSGYFDTNGTFSFTGSLGLNFTVGSGLTEFGITGVLAVTIKNTGFTGYGDVGLVVLGTDIPIATAELSVDWEAGTFLIRAELPPVGVWLEVTPSDSFPYFSIDGGLGVFDDVFKALGDAAEAVGEAITDAGEAVYDALVDLGEAIVEVGEDVVEFFEDVGEAIADAAEAVWDEISSWFEDERTLVYKYGLPTPTAIRAYYVYSTYLDPSSKTLTITNGTSYGYAPQLTLWVVDGNLIVDAPNTTKDVIISTSQKQERDYTWDGWPPWGEWGSWYNVGPAQTQTANINITNATNFALGSVEKIVINGTDYDETIILDRKTITINTDVHANGGNDVIATGKGNDRVWGGDGNDTIFTYEGNDGLYGENHNDKLCGGTGNDELYGGSGNDLLDESRDRESPITPISETNILNGGNGVDQILGSPGNDTIEGGSGDDVLVGLANDDTYVFNNNYGTDRFVDYFGEETLDFSGATNALDITMSENGITANAGAGNSLSIDRYAWIEELRIGTGDDDVTIAKLPGHLIDIVDPGGNDRYDFDLDATDTAQSVCRIGIIDNAGSDDEIYVGLDSPGFVTYSGIERVNVRADTDGISVEGESGPDGTDLTYDGDGNGTPDCDEDNVASFHTATQDYVTLIGETGTDLWNVSVTMNPSSQTLPVEIEAPYGFVQFEVEGVAAGEESMVDILLPSGSMVNSYYKYGPTPDNRTAHWYEFLYDGHTGAEILGNVIRLHFVDGSRGDGDLIVNGSLSDPGGPVYVDRVAPVVTVVSLTTTDGSPELTGTVDDPTAAVVVTVGGVEYQAVNSGGAWTVAAGIIGPLVEDVYEVSVTATDPAGNIGRGAGTITVAPAGPQQLNIDIYPNRAVNQVYLSRNYTLYVVVFGTGAFNVMDLDWTTVRFGRTGTEARAVRAPLLRDMNGDGILDALYGFMTFDCGFQMGDTEGILTAKLNDGTDASGDDSVLVSP